MIDALVGGSLVGAPVEKVSASGRTFVTARMRVPVTESDSVFILVSAFDSDVRRALLAHAAGDSIALTGPLRLGLWTPPQGGETRLNVSMIAHGVLSAYAIKRRREAMREQGRPAGAGETRTSRQRELAGLAGSQIADDPPDDAF